jgi:hypothetical protein
MILRNDFSISKNAATDQRAGMPGRQRQTRRVRSRTPECGLSTMLLENDDPDASGALLEGLEECFTINQVDIPHSLHRCLANSPAPTCC